MNFGSTPRTHVLVVDDCPATRELLGIILSGEGYEVTSASDGQLALDRLRDRLRPDLVLLDLVMPGVDGWEFLERKNRDPELAHIPVIILSGVGDEVTDVRRLGAVCSIPKPIPEDALIDSVVGAIRSHVA